MAGQFGKPRSAPDETIDGVTLPTYRGDIVNGPDFDLKSRTADPVRMLEAHRQSKVTIDLLKAYSAAAYADLSEIHRAARRRLGLGFEHATPQGDIAQPAEMFTSHEALAAQLRAGADPLGRAHRKLVGDLGAHDLDRRAHPPARRRPCRYMPAASPTRSASNAARRWSRTICCA